MVLLFLMLLALPLASRAKDTFYIAPVNVVPGESKTITLNLDNSQVFRGFQTDIELPEGLKIASKSNGNFDISLTDRGSSSFSVSSNLMSDGSVRILGYSTQGESIKGNQGALVRISVRASSDFSGGYIKLKNSIFSDVNNRDVKLDNSQLFVGTKEQNDVSVKGGEISPEVSKAFSLELSNESEMTAFQMDVVLPNGLSLDLSKTRLTGRCGNHQLQTKQLGNGKVRIICMSSNNTSISGKIGSVIELWIKAEKGIAGNQIVKLENIIFSDVKARTYRMDPFSFVVDVKYVPATSVSISESNMQLEVSDSRQLTASLLPENCTDKTILWKSDNEKVATVSDNGMIFARSAGKCSIIASTADNLIQAKCVVTVVKIPLTAHVANTTKVYGDANPEFNITYSGFRDGDSEVGFSVPASISTILDNSSKVGKYDIVASGAVSDKYEISYIPGTLTVTKAPLSISAGNYTKKQGDAMPVFKASYAGFKNGENESVLTKQPVFSCDANEASAPGEYPINVYGVQADNYEVTTYIPGTLTICKRELKNQTITWDQEIKAKVGSTIEMNATASSGLPVRYSYIQAPGVESAYRVPQIEGNNITFPEEGAYMLVAIQDGNDEYSAATDTLDVCAISDDEGLMYIDGIYYKYTSDGSALKVVRGYNPYRGKVEIPAYVNGMPVVEVDRQAMYACYYLNEVVIGDNVANCGREAFGASRNLQKVTLPANQAELRLQYIFNCDDGIKEIHCRSSVPYLADESLFNGFVNYDNCILYVPVGTMQAYTNTEIWRNFTHIVEENVITGIAIVVRAKSYSRQYGDENPVFEFETEGAALDGTPEIVCSAVANSPVGSYTIEVKQGSIKNYNVHFESGTLTVTKAPLTISAGNYTKKQGDAMPVFKASYAGFKNGEDESVLTKQPVFSCEANESSAPADYAVTISGAEAENYAISYEQGHLTVVEADAIVVRAKSYSRQYGDENPVFEFETEGAALDGTPEIVCSAVANSPVGSYSIEVKQGSIKNYNVHFESGSLVITKAPLSISAGNYTKKQGDAMPVFKASYAGFKNGENESVLTKQPVFSCEANEASAPAEYAVTISGADAENYDISYEQGRLTVVEADAVVVRAKSYSRQYGDENPVFEFETEGVALDGTPEIVCSAVANSPVGSYSIEVKQGSIKNYNVHFELGSLVITKAPLSISAGNYTKKQGDAMPVFKASYAGFKNGENESVLTKQPVFSCEANEASAPAEYAVTISGADAENYDISYEQGRLTVVEADAVVVRAKSYSRQYGDDNPVFEFETEGAALDGTPEIVCSAVANSPVGSYTIEVKQGSIKNYNVHFESGSLVITKAPLSISAGNYTKKQGDAMPVFKASYAGFKNGENESVLTKQPVFSCEANEASAPAEYAVTISGADAENYDISYEQGRLTVVEADAVVVRAKSYSRQYGDENPVFEFETEGAALDGTPEIVCSAVANSPVGSYTIEVKQGSIKNYNVHFESGSLVITKAPLSISAGNYTKKQGDAMPVFKASYVGFKNGEDESVLTKQPVFSCEANEASAPGEYPITVYGVEADNYEVKSYIAGTLTVLKRELKKQTITWDQEIKAKVGSTIAMNATASSGLPVRYSYALAPGVESAYRAPQIEDNNITFPEEGTYMLVAIQDGNNEYAAATDTLDVCAISDDEGLMYIDGIYYKYTDDGSALKVVRGYNPYRGKVEIPATVNGLPVTEVDGLAMYACYYLKELIIGDNVKKCGHEAFGASVNLCNVTLPVADVEFTYNWMFNCDRGIREIHCRSSIPYVVEEGIFNGAVDYDKCILYVPVGTKQAYRNAEVWKYFTHIVEEEVATEILNVCVSSAKGTWYTLQGAKLFGKPRLPGVYIHDGKKMIVR